MIPLSLQVIWLGYFAAKLAAATAVAAAVPSGVKRSETVKVNEPPGCTL